MTVKVADILAILYATVANKIENFDSKRAFTTSGNYKHVVTAGHFDCKFG